MGIYFSSAVRGWLIFTSLFELPLIYSCASSSLNKSGSIDTSKLKGLYSNLGSSQAGKRLIAFALSVIVAARLAAAADVENATLQRQNAAIHVLEAIYFGREMLVHGANGNKAILAAIFGQAVLYCAWAAKLQL